MVKTLLQWMSPAGAGARLSTLIFHRVLPAPDPLFPDEMDARRFAEVCGWLKSWFNVLPLDQAVIRLKAGTLPVRAACITFDDGYADNFEVAMPILQRHGLTATFFIATGFLNGGRMWNDTIIETVRNGTSPLLDFSSLNLGRHPVTTLADKRAAIAALIDQVKYQPLAQRISVTEQIARLAQVQLPQDLMMTSLQVKAMHQAGMQIGAHTVSHPILARLSEDQARQEISDSQIFLERLLGERVGLFAYPNGKPGEDYSLQAVEVVRSLGFDAAFSTQWGASRQGDDPLQIRRFTPWDRTRLRFGMRMLRNLREG
ncbi:polysaccharide deacetylase family protein [Rhodoferax sediminis]|jgi:peptidoglycan/xylan/chitin deacetylase (PgdA/CDA1 family)|uniref:Polysaccharide deacetylase family protein n=1 Tax=Rhodoferax sediminis TaxID=2509614 RepID=A0A515DAV1_9BURK|nr:polysaccharide deacetylase family protein [Rhodoferax sediminis]QDL37525.1 polysaccharide deacetylase family protein [Rhodoferax sediminis]